jgi:hypothetical protein
VRLLPAARAQAAKEIVRDLRVFEVRQVAVW